jgi:hypothetical protein
MKPTTKKTKRKWWGALSKIQTPRERCLFDSFSHHVYEKRFIFSVLLLIYSVHHAYWQIGWAYFTDDEENENKVVTASSSLRREDRERFPPRSFHDDESKVSVCAFYLISSF